MKWVYNQGKPETPQKALDMISLEERNIPVGEKEKSSVNNVSAAELSTPPSLGGPWWHQLMCLERVIDGQTQQDQYHTPK